MALCGAGPNYRYLWFAPQRRWDTVHCNSTASPKNEPRDSSVVLSRMQTSAFGKQVKHPVGPRAAPLRPSCLQLHRSRSPRRHGLVLAIQQHFSISSWYCETIFYQTLAGLVGTSCPRVSTSFLSSPSMRARFTAELDDGKLHFPSTASGSVLTPGVWFWTFQEQYVSSVIKYSGSETP